MVLKQKGRRRKQGLDGGRSRFKPSGEPDGRLACVRGRESSCGKRYPSFFGVTDELDLQGDAGGRVLGTSCLKHNGDDGYDGYDGGDGGGMRCSSGGVKWKLNGWFFLPSTIQPSVGGGCSQSRLLCLCVSNKYFDIGAAHADVDKYLVLRWYCL
jgi:hypothetical protein